MDVSLRDNRPVVLVTGCGSGLGLALARKLRTFPKFRTVATTRSQESAEKLRLELIENDHFKIDRLDVTNHAERERLIAGIYHRWGTIDVLVNNAAICFRSVVEQMDDEAELLQMDINYLSPFSLIRLVLPGMREKGAGQIINVSSVSGMVSMPTMASYSASKHALEGATEALWYELRPFGISVSLIQPGFIRSSSYEKVQLSRKATLSRDLEGPYSEYYQHMGVFVERLMRRSFTPPEKIADTVIEIIQSPEPPLWVPVTLDAFGFFWLRKLLPRTFFHKFMFRFLPAVRSWGLKRRMFEKGEISTFSSRFLHPKSRD